LNKVQKIGAADAESYKIWAMNALFAACAWNGTPVDGTDIIRSFVAKARTFHIPLDVQTEEEIARMQEQPFNMMRQCAHRGSDRNDC
jgi:hypothetical protein